MKHNKTSVYIFGGKGGVGKTTTAAATGVYFAERGKRTLVLSSDPTPSLSDIFQTRLEHLPRALPEVPNLWALEISNAEIKRQWKEKFGPEIHEAITSIIPVEFDVVDYVAGAPGIDEEFLLDYIHSLIINGKFDVVIWDTAPAGHTLRLLQLPREFLEHLNTATKLYFKVKSYLAKVRGVKTQRPLPTIVKEWANLADSVKKLLTNPGHSFFAIVTTPETLVVQQTQRIYQELITYGITPQRIIINSIIPETTDPFLQSRREMQQTNMETLVEYFTLKGIDITRIPLLAYDVVGVPALQKIKRYLDL